MTNDVIECIFKRRSVRRYLDQPLEEEKLTLLLQAAMAAPNACNSHPWEFIVVTDKNVLDQLRDKLMFARYNAPAAIVVCGSPDLADNTTARRYWEQDCSAATENILIAATSLGLGTVWIGVHPLPSVIKPVSKILAIPETVIPLNLVYVGYPAETPAPRTQYDDYRIYWQHYEPRKRRAKIKNAKYNE